ncbi:MAG: trypsin-like peptidase domain-containing protein [Acidimicrobiales bacterium]
MGLTSLVLVAAACSSGGDGPPATPTAVSIVATGCGPVPQRGQGVAIDDARAVTVAHVVAGADDISVETADGTVHPATIEAIDVANDLALLRVEGLDAQPVRFVDLAVGDAGRLGTTTPYEVLDVVEVRINDIYDDLPTERDAVHIAADVAEGDSGSALIDEQGRVGALLFSKSRDDPSTAYATSAAEVELFLADRAGQPAASPVACRADAS